MKRLCMLMLLVMAAWVSIFAQETSSINLTFEADNVTGSWHFLRVTNVDKLKVGDVVTVSFDAQTTSSQFGVKNTNGGSFTVSDNFIYILAGVTSYTFTVTEKVLENGMAFSYENLTNVKAVAVRNGSSSGGSTGGGSESGGGNTGGSTQPGGDEVSVVPSNPIWSQEINHVVPNWYEDDNTYKLKVDNANSYIGKVLRIVCSNTGYDSYAFLKYSKDLKSIMSGADKFSIAGWKYFEITINSQLAGYLSDGFGLAIGGNSYCIVAAYIYDGGKKAEDWKDGDLVNSYTFPSVIDGSSDWASAKVPGSFFEYKDNNPAGEKLANTKNNIIRICFEWAGDNAQVSAKDTQNDNKASYIRQRNYENWNYFYVNYADCKNAQQYDFELSDAITLFEDWNKPVVDTKENPTGTQTGMLSTLLQNGMNIGCKNAKIDKIEIRESQVSKYVTGLAVHSHKLSGTYWKPISLPYNLTQEQFKDAFGAEATFCELGKADVIKTVKDKETIFGMQLHFKPVKGELKANYPYIINLCDKSADEQRDFTIKNVKADVRDFQAYTFRTPNFDCSKLENADERNEYEEKLKGAYMNFISTAPIFTFVNTKVGEVEHIEDTKARTTLNPQPTDTWYNFAFKDGGIHPVDKRINLGASLAYIQFSEQAKNLIDGTMQQQANSKVYYVFDEDNTATGIENISDQAVAAKSVKMGVYNMNGQLVRRGNSTEGLTKGLYIVNGKKVIVK